MEDCERPLLAHASHVLRERPEAREQQEVRNEHE